MKTSLLGTIHYVSMFGLWNNSMDMLDSLNFSNLHKYLCNVCFITFFRPLESQVKMIKEVLYSTQITIVEKGKNCWRIHMLLWYFTGNLSKGNFINLSKYVFNNFKVLILEGRSVFNYVDKKK